MLSTKARRPRRRVRLAPSDRRDALLQAAARLLTAQGPDGVQFAEVAKAAGVTRQFVYRFFPNRQTLLMAVLEDFAAELTRRFGEHAVRSLPTNMTDATRIVVEAVCDTIEVKGAGPWHLLDAKGPDAEIAKLGRDIADRLLQPWLARIRHATGASPREVTALARMIVAAGRAVLDLWYDGTLTRDEAVRDASRGVSAMLGAFTATAATPRRR